MTRSASGRLSLVVGCGLLGGVVLLALFADVVAPGDPFTSSAATLRPPDWTRPFGSDDFGRDLWRSVVHGARVSMVVALVAAATAVALGTLIGSVAGYAGGLVDDLLMRVTEVFQVVPRFFLVVTAVSLFGSGFALLALIIATTSWASTARLVRGQVLTLKGYDHVMAARALGAGPARVLLHHVLRLAIAPLGAQAAFQAGGALLLEAGVSFLGLGDPAVMSWGALLHDAHHFLRVAWWMAFFPGLALTVAVLGLHLIADGITVRR
jgi:peptide/nickel transport system permease protein